MNATLANPMLWLVIVGSLTYVGVLALCALLGVKTAYNLDNLASATLAARVLRDYRSWALLMALILMGCMAAAASEHIKLAVALLMPYIYVAALGIYREGRVAQPAPGPHFVRLIANSLNHD